MSTSANQDNRFSINARRAYMVRQLRSRGILAYSRYNHRWSNPSSATLELDIKALNQLGFEIETIEAGGRRYLVDATAKHLFTKSHRTDLNAQSKDAIGLVATSLFLGLPAPIPSELGEDKKNPLQKSEFSNRQRLIEKNPELLALWHKGEIEEALSGQGPAQGAATELKRKLRQLWSMDSINLYIDAGTTSDRIASRCRDLLIPTVFSSLRCLNVCTNSPSIFSALGDPEICIRTILVGGTQVIPSEALAGQYSEAFFRATSDSLKFAISFIGATGVDLRRGEVLSDTIEEKQLKSLAFDRSNIRVVCVDSTKISWEPMRNAFCFSRLNPAQVDLFIINEKPATGGLNPQSEEDIRQLIDSIRTLGVPVIAAKHKEDLSPTKELSRGLELKIRVPQSSIDDIVNKLNWVEDQPNKCMELFINALLSKFIEYSKDGSTHNEVAIDLVGKFDELVNNSNLRSLVKSTIPQSGTP